MLSLKVEDPKVEEIFLEGFGSNKESFFRFIIDAYEKQKILVSLDKSCKQAILQQNGELGESTLQDLIDEL
ncbi:MAG: hypothetical protein GY940_04015 [bacterium]|nr:hypothetical protein [bacterium]